MNLDLARWQFATTTVYHFLFVPVSIGLAFLVALLQTAWYRNGGDDYRRLARFFGTLLVINVAVGVVTGIVQEFEFGMNWSAYSRFVGNIFGGPLAMEGLAAFFLESTFLGLWIFGWDRLPRRVHLATIWLVSLGTVLSAAFIMAANSWMQHPVGYKLGRSGVPKLTNIWALFTNPVFLWGYLHVILASLVTGSLVMLAASAWHLRRRRQAEAFQRSARVSLVVLTIAIVLAFVVGGELGVIEAKYQPMKIAAAEAQWTTCKPCSFSLFQIGGGNNDETPSQIIQVPHLLSVLATNTWNGRVIGLHELQAQYAKKYGPGNYVPDVFIQYWAMRVMAYVASVVALFAFWGVWLLYRRKLAGARWFLTIAPWAFLCAFVMNTAGWLLTENGRQPWVAQGLLKTMHGVSPTVSATEVWITLIGFFALYAVLGAIAAFLMVRFARRPLERTATDGESPGRPGEEASREPSFSY